MTKNPLGELWCHMIYHQAPIFWIRFPKKWHICPNEHVSICHNPSRQNFHHFNKGRELGATQTPRTVAESNRPYTPTERKVMLGKFPQSMPVSDFNQWFLYITNRFQSIWGIHFPSNPEKNHLSNITTWPHYHPLSSSLSGPFLYPIKSPLTAPRLQ